MKSAASSRVGNVVAMARILKRLPARPDKVVQQRRRMVAEFCRLLGAEHSAPPRLAAGLRPRMAQTLHRLLAGDSEKEIASRLGVSTNTIHCYVKDLYRHFQVSSRGQLLARFVEPGRQTVESGK